MARGGFDDFRHIEGFHGSKRVAFLLSTLICDEVRWAVCCQSLVLMKIVL